MGKPLNVFFPAFLSLWCRLELPRGGSWTCHPDNSFPAVNFKPIYLNSGFLPPPCTPHQRKKSVKGDKICFYLRAASATTSDVHTRQPRTLNIFQRLIPRLYTVRFKIQVHQGLNSAPGGTRGQGVLGHTSGRNSRSKDGVRRKSRVSQRSNGSPALVDQGGRMCRMSRLGRITKWAEWAE